MGTPVEKALTVTVASIEALRVDTRTLKGGGALVVIYWRGLDGSGREVLAPTRYDVPAKDAQSFLAGPVTLAAAEAILAAAIALGPGPLALSVAASPSPAENASASATIPTPRVPGAAVRARSTIAAARTIATQQAQIAQLEAELSKKSGASAVAPKPSP